MKSFFYKLLAGALVLMSPLLQSCGEVHKINERVVVAETAMAEHDIELSRRICDEILCGNSDNEISAAEYARLSILYMHFYENADDADALDRAVSCYRRGVEINADSVKAVYSSLPADDHKYAYALSMIVGGLDNPADPAVDDDRYVSPDSVGVINEEQP
ncbi:MAG: hypothetical protein K2L91_08745 [Duncaniella sp.]|nr:hypothetical protein [Duncaniella sp.]